MSQSPAQQNSNDSGLDSNNDSGLDSNWRSDALDLSLDYGMQTVAVRAGQHRTDEGEHSEAIFTTSSYVYESASDAAAHFNGTKTGNVYSRHTNPSVRTFERRLAALENGERAVATAQGMMAALHDLNADRAAAGEPALDLPALVGAGALRYVDFPPGLAERYQSYTQADLAALRGAGYAGEFTRVEQGVAAYVQNLLAGRD